MIRVLIVSVLAFQLASCATTRRAIVAMKVNDSEAHIGSTSITGAVRTFVILG